MIPGITCTPFPSSLNFTKHQFSSLSLCVPSSLDFDQSYFYLYSIWVLCSSPTH